MTVRNRVARIRRGAGGTVARRVGWGLADQAVSSLTNFLVGVVAARTLGATDFGLFSLAWVTFGLVLNVSRGLASDPLVVRFSGPADERWREAVRRSTGTALVIGCVGGLVCALVGLALGDGLGAALIGLGAVLPFLVLQDCWRFAFFASGRGRHAFVNDLVWGIALVPALLVADRHPAAVWFVVAWGVSGGVAAAAGLGQARLVPDVTAAWTWVRDHRDLGLRYMVENLCQSGAGQARMYGLGAIAGAAAVGTVRGGELLLGPFLAVLMGINLVAVPEATRIVRREVGRLRPFCLLVGGVQWFAALCWGLALLLLLPAAVGAYLLGAVWPTASQLIVPATLSVMSAGLSSGASTGLRALGAAALGLRAQLIASVFYVGGGLTGALLGGAVGSAWGVAGGALVGVGVWWWSLGVGVRRHRAHVEPRTEPDKQAEPGVTG
ncbi:hypothetical protein [Pseudonocardia xishanensis]|uniref:O-antigen/teichoic acid export membrane protein n=1 Tax=Pseudonocardia xishanensis TaxID=630995 RepID=A0ABP8S204_9PSEU